MEKRRHSRTPLVVPVAVIEKGREERVPGRSRDLSLGGMFIEIDAPSPFGAEIVVLVKLPRDDRVMTLPAVVRWTTTSGMGVQFGLLGARDTHAITEATRSE